MTDIAGKVLEKDLTFDDPGTLSFPNTGPAPIPSTQKGFDWGGASSTNSATVVIQWSRPNKVETLNNSVEVTEVVEANDGNGNTVIGASRPADPSTPVVFDESPPATSVTYTVTLFYENTEQGRDYTKQTVSTTVNTSDQTDLPWDSSVKDTTNRLINISLPLSPPTGETIVTDELRADYNGTTTTLVSGGVPRNVHDVAAPSGDITYTHEIVTEDESGNQTSTTNTYSVNTVAPHPPLLGNSEIHTRQIFWASEGDSVVNSLSESKTWSQSSNSRGTKVRVWK